MVAILTSMYQSVIDIETSVICLKLFLVSTYLIAFYKSLYNGKQALAVDYSGFGLG